MRRLVTGFMETIKISHDEQMEDNTGRKTLSGCGVGFKGNKRMSPTEAENTNVYLDACLEPHGNIS